MAVGLKLLGSTLCLPSQFKTVYSFSRKSHLQASAAEISLNKRQYKASFNAKTIDSHLHIWASPEEATDEYSYFPGQEPTLPGHLQLLLQSHSYDFLDGYRAVQFKPYLWPSGQQGLYLHIAEIEKLCTEFPSTVLLLDHLAFCKPPIFLQVKYVGHPFPGLFCIRKSGVYVKFIALFRVSRMASPYQDFLSPLLSQLVSSFGANRIIWGSDFPFVVPESGYNGAKEFVAAIANEIPLSSSKLGVDHG